jgi:hypothetical protein
VVRTGFGQIRWLFNIVFSPEKLIQVSSGYYNQTRTSRLKILISVTLFFLANIILYALPLSLAEIGFVEEESAHPRFAEISQHFVRDPDYAWMVLVRLVNNGQFLVIFGFLTYFLYHLGIWLTRKSNGAILSYRVVMINTSIYLAIIFNLAWLAVGSSQTAIAGNLLDWFFREYFAIVADFMNSPPPFGQETQPDPARLSLSGKATLAGLIISLCYYWYVLYVGAIKIHGMTRYEAALVIGFTTTSPLLFAAGSILISRFIDLPPALTF